MIVKLDADDLRGLVESVVRENKSERASTELTVEGLRKIIREEMGKMVDESEGLRGFEPNSFMDKVVDLAKQGEKGQDQIDAMVAKLSPEQREEACGSDDLVDCYIWMAKSAKEMGDERASKVLQGLTTAYEEWNAKHNS